jgi:hypothetical protein
MTNAPRRLSSRANASAGRQSHKSLGIWAMQTTQSGHFARPARRQESLEHHWMYRKTCRELPSAAPLGSIIRSHSQIAVVR